MTLLESIITAGSIGVDEVSLLHVMAQNCDATGAIPFAASDKDIMQLWNIRFKEHSRRASQDKVGEWLDNLEERKCIPTRYSVYPPSEASAPKELQERLDRILALRERMDSRVPLHERKVDHARIAYALLMAEAPEAGYKLRAEDVGSPTDLYTYVNGVRLRSKEYVWEFGLVQEWINSYGIDGVLDTICALQQSKTFQQVPIEATFSERQKALRSILIKTLANRGTGSKNRAYDPPAKQEQFIDDDDFPTD